MNTLFKTVRTHKDDTMYLEYQDSLYRGTEVYFFDDNKVHSGKVSLISELSNQEYSVTIYLTDEE